jgi:predicted RNA binding protein YcfA (HicA-like mRNA interferase family)
MATVGSNTAAAINRMRTIFFETLHPQGSHTKKQYKHPKDNPTVLNIPFKRIYRDR